MRSGQCPLCGQPYSRGAVSVEDPRKKSVDHILPQVWGGTDSMYPVMFNGLQDRTRNLRDICQGCNVRRASVGHCVAAMACVADVAIRSGRPYRDVYRGWGMHRLAEQANYVGAQRARSGVNLGLAKGLRKNTRVH